QEEEEADDHEASSQKHCDHCDLLVPLPAWGQHLRSALHLFLKNRAAAHRPPHYYFLPESNVGYQMMLRRFHWQEEKGLGREGREGRLDPIATRLKRNRLGVGHRDEEKPRITHVGVNEVAVREAEERRSRGRKRRAARRRRKEREEEERKREERIRDAVFH
ncbi:G patch domain and ankyrin repeat-containing protein 1, partial [Balamuthia mandrillaris]